MDKMLHFFYVTFLIVLLSPLASKAQTIFRYNMADAQEGRMPRYWYTHSVGQVVSVPGEAGKWLKLSNESTYQLDTLLKLPPSFTVNFKLLTRVTQSKDLRDIYFGFAKTPKTKTYIFGVQKDQSVVSTFLQFYYNKVRTKSNATGIENSLAFPLENYGNAVIPVRLEVDGKRMLVYIDDQLVLDADALDLTSPKYFYISTRELRNDAAVYLGEFEIRH